MFIPQLTYHTYIQYNTIQHNTIQYSIQLIRMTSTYPKREGEYIQIFTFFFGYVLVIHTPNFMGVWHPEYIQRCTIPIWGYVSNIGVL